jgi:hypothetical protein
MDICLCSILFGCLEWVWHPYHQEFVVHSMSWWCSCVLLCDGPCLFTPLVCYSMFFLLIVCAIWFPLFLSLWLFAFYVVMLLVASQYHE